MFYVQNKTLFPGWQPWREKKSINERGESERKHSRKHYDLAASRRTAAILCWKGSADKREYTAAEVQKGVRKEGQCIQRQLGATYLTPLGHSLSDLKMTKTSIRRKKELGVENWPMEKLAMTDDSNKRQVHIKLKIMILHLWPGQNVLSECSYIWPNFCPINICRQFSETPWCQL